MKGLFLLFTTFLFSLAGDHSYVLLKANSSKANYFTTDHLGNAYVVEEDELKKYSPEGILLATYSNNNLGELTTVDASDPLKPLLFFKDLSKIIFLDNTLSANDNAIQLFQNDPGQATLACISRSNGTWVYNALNFELLFLDHQNEKNKRIPNLHQLLNIDLEPNFMLEYNNWLYLNNPKTGILVFDIFGTYYKTIPIKSLGNFQLFENSLIYFSENKLVNYQMKTFESDTITLPVNNCISARIEKDRLYILKENLFEVYKIQ